MQRPSTEAAFLLSQRSYHTRGGLVYIPHRNTESTTGLALNPPTFGTTRRAAGTVTRHHRGLLHLPNQNMGTVSSTPVVDLTLIQTARPSTDIIHGTVVHRYDDFIDPRHRQTTAVSTAPAFSPATNPISWGPPSITQGQITEVPQDSSSLGHHAPPEHVSMTATIQPTPGSVPGLSSSTAQMNLGVVPCGSWESLYSQGNSFSLGSPGHTPATHTAPPTTETLGQSDTPHTNGPPHSPTSPTPAGPGRQWRSRPSHTPGQEVPQMIGEMRDVIDNLAMSVNSLKDVVSDLRAGQSTGSGSIPVRGSRGRRGGGRCSAKNSC